MGGIHIDIDDIVLGQCASIHAEIVEASIEVRVRCNVGSAEIVGCSRDRSWIRLTAGTGVLQCSVQINIIDSCGRYGPCIVTP